MLLTAKYLQPILTGLISIRIFMKHSFSMLFVNSSLVFRDDTTLVCWLGGTFFCLIFN